MDHGSNAPDFRLQRDVMAGLVPAIPRLWLGWRFKSWMPGSSPGMTGWEARAVWARRAEQGSHNMVIGRDFTTPMYTLHRGAISMPHHRAPVLFLYLTGGR